MAYIEIIKIPNGPAACSGYFFRDGAPGKVCEIKADEVAYIRDDELEKHLDKGLVTQTTASRAQGRIVNPEDAPKPGPKPNAA